MNKKPILFSLLMVCLAASPVFAQGGLWKSFVEWMTADNDKLDSMYVWQSPTDWTVTLENDVYMSGIHLNTKGKLLYVNTPELNHEYTWKGLIQSNLSDEFAFAVTWGALSIGWGFDVTNTSTDERNKSYSFSFLDAGAGLSVNYNSIYSNINSVYHNLVTDSSAEINTMRPGHYQTLVIEGYDVISKDKFAFNACYDGSYVQRRTGGSFLLYAKYIRGKLDLPTDEYQFVRFNNNVMGYATNQLFIGGGYGINFVPFHRDPDNGFHGLRNLTINVVLCPMLTLVNKLYYIEGQYDATTNQWVKVDERVAAGQPDFNMAVRGAVCYNFGRYALSAIFTYNRFKLATTGTEFMNTETDYYDSECQFYDWKAMLSLNIRL